MLNRLIAIHFLCLVAVSSCFFIIGLLIIWLFTFWFDKRLVIVHYFTCLWSCFYLWVMPVWAVRVEGRKNMDKNKTYVIVANHQSQLDILAAFKLFFHFKWVSKIEVFKIPAIGWAMMLNRYIRLNRGNRTSTQKMFVACEKALAQGSSIFFFPEGTRSQTGIIKPFKPGAFILAQKMKKPVLPIAISGAKEALPKHSLVFQGQHDIKVKVLPAIPYDIFKEMSPNNISSMVRSKIVEHVHVSSII